MEWEYKLIDLVNTAAYDLTLRLHGLGLDGWEAVGEVATSDGRHLLLKRPRGAEPEITPPRT